MKLLIVAAGGGLGSTLVHMALEAGHEVTALVRSKERLCAKIGKETLSKIRVFEGDAQDISSLREACQGADTVIEVLANSARELAIPALAKAAAEAGVKNVVATGGVPALMKLTLPEKFDKIVLQHPLVGDFAKVHLQTFKALSESTLPAWCEVCPGQLCEAASLPGMVSGKASGQIWGQAGEVDWSMPLITSYEDTAALMLSLGVDVRASGFNKQLVGLKNLAGAIPEEQTIGWLEKAPTKSNL